MEGMNRPLSDEEEAIVRWLIERTDPLLSRLSSTVSKLRVVDRCGCGCPSVDFEVDGQRPPAQPIANAAGATVDGDEVGVILWGTAEAITGLEVYGVAPPPPRGLPLQPTPQARSLPPPAPVSHRHSIADAAAHRKISSPVPHEPRSHSANIGACTVANLSAPAARQQMPLLGCVPLAVSFIPCCRSVLLRR